MNRKVNVAKCKDLYPQCNFCLSKQDVYTIQGEGLSALTSICEKCVDNLKLKVDDIRTQDTTS